MVSLGDPREAKVGAPIRVIHFFSVPKIKPEIDDVFNGFWEPKRTPNPPKMLKNLIQCFLSKDPWQQDIPELIMSFFTGTIPQCFLVMQKKCVKIL